MAQRCCPGWLQFSFPQSATFHQPHYALQLPPTSAPPFSAPLTPIAQDAGDGEFIMRTLKTLLLPPRPTHSSLVYRVPRTMTVFSSSRTRRCCPCN